MTEQGRDRTGPRTSGSSEGSAARRWWLVPVAVVACALAALLWYRALSIPGKDLSPEATGPPPPPEEPPLAFPAELLGLSAEVPESAEALREETLAVGRGLIADLPDRPEAQAVVALMHMRYGQTEEAMARWEKALALNARFSPAYLGMGTIAAQKAEYDRATKRLRKALELSPQLPAAYDRLTECLLQQGKADEALPVAREYVRRYPNARESHYWLGQTYLDLGRYEEADQSHQRALRIDPELTPSYYSLAIARAKLGRREEATEHRKRFASLKQSDMHADRGRSRLYRDVAEQRDVLAGTHMSAGDVHLRFGDPRKAEAHWRRGAAVAPRHVPCREALATLYEMQNRPQAALDVLDGLLDLDPENASYWTQAGRMHAARNAFDSAERAFRKAVELQPEAADAYVGLVELGLRSGRPLDDAHTLALKAAELAPSGKTYLLLSAVRSERGDGPGALAAVEKALKLEPGNPELQRIHDQIRQSVR